MIGSTGSAMALIVEWFLKTTILLAPALIAAAIFKRRTAAFRHFLLSFALIGLLLVPVLSLLPIGWRTPLLPARPYEPLTMEPASEAGFVSTEGILLAPDSAAIRETVDRIPAPVPPAPRPEARMGFSKPGKIRFRGARFRAFQNDRFGFGRAIDGYHRRGDPIRLALRPRPSSPSSGLRFGRGRPHDPGRDGAG